MGVKLYRELKLEKPIMFVGWPGIGNIGIIAINTLRAALKAEELGEIEPWEFFDPSKVSIRDGLLRELEFPTNRFYWKSLREKDSLFFINEQQPTGEEKMYQMANLVLDVAEKFGCQRVYTSGAAVAPIHHTMRPKVRAVPNNSKLIDEVKGYENTVLMSEIEGRGSQGSISGLNGLLLGVAKKRGFDAICLMGEIPDWLSGAPFPYPKASESVFEVFAGLLGIRIDLSIFDKMEAEVNKIIEAIYESFPLKMKEKYDQRKEIVRGKPEAITEEDARWIKEHIDEFFEKGGEK